MPSRFYTASNGKRYPLTEARYDIGFRVYKSDRRKAIPCDPHSCLLARGILRDKDVLDVYVGSGKDAYVVFKGNNEEEEHAVHFTIKSSVRKVIDAFDKDKKAASQMITLSRPTKARTHDARQESNLRRRAEIKAGAPVNKRKNPVRQRRITRLGVAHRPPAPLSKSGNVDVSTHA